MYQLAWSQGSCILFLTLLYIILTFASIIYKIMNGLPSWLSGKESACHAGDVGSIPGSGRSPGRGHGNLLQYSCLENPMDREAWRATVHGVTESTLK